MRNPLLSLILTGLFSSLLAQTPEVYWGLTWDMYSSQVDSVLNPVAKEKKAATKTIYSESRQIRGFVYRIEDRGIEKIYVWYYPQRVSDGNVHSIEIVYRFEYPYDAVRFKEAYSDKYGHAFSVTPQGFKGGDGSMVYLRIVEEPPTGKLGNSVYLVTLQSPRAPEESEEQPDFLY